MAIKILTYYSSLNKKTYEGGGAIEIVINKPRQYSKYDITFCSKEDIDKNKYNADDFDILHIHTDIHEKFLEIKQAKIIYNIHNLVLTCPTGGFFCSVLNKFLDKPLTCLNCLGYVGIKTGGDNLQPYIKMAKKADVLLVHSEFMREFYHTYNPVILPLPLETDILTPCDPKDKEDYIFYTGKLIHQKNPFGFVDIINKTGLKGKMAIFDDNVDYTGVKKIYKETLEKKNKNIEVIYNPPIEKLADLIKYARFTVLPYLYPEPFGVAPADSILCGTPLVTFPYGNLRSFTNLLPKTLDEMIQMVMMNDKQYNYILKETLIKGNELREIHDPNNAIKKLDELYYNVVNNKRII